MALQFGAEIENLSGLQLRKSPYDQKDCSRNSRRIVCCSVRVRPNEIQPHEVAVANCDAHSDSGRGPNSSAKNGAEARADSNKAIANAVTEDIRKSAESDADAGGFTNVTKDHGVAGSVEADLVAAKDSNAGATATNIGTDSS